MNCLKIVIGNLNNPNNQNILDSYSIFNRLPNILKDIDGANVVVFSEVYHDNVDFIKKQLNSQGYICYDTPYSTLGINTSPFHIIGVDKNIQVLCVRPVWFTSKPEIEIYDSDPLLDKCQEKFSKSALSIVFRYYNDTFIVTGTHFSLPRYYRDNPFQYQFECANILMAHISKLQTRFPDASIIIGSDFNTFSSKPVNIFKKFKLIDITPPGDTFVSFPTDLGIPCSAYKKNTRKCVKQFKNAKSDTDIVAAAYEYFTNTRGDLLRARLDRIYCLLQKHKTISVSMTDMSKVTLDGILKGTPQSASDHALFYIMVK